jgi:D-alanyl-D-alanine dipeptidase
MAPDYSARLSGAAEQVRLATLDALIVAPSADLVYLLGYDPPPLERLTALILLPDHDPVLLVPELERPRAASSPAAALVAILTWPDGAEPYSAVGRVVGGGMRLAVSDRMWASHLLGLQAALGREASFVPATPVLAPLRARKDPAEIDLLERAATGADEAFGLVAAEGIGGRTEQEVATSLARHLLKAGHESAGFTIVASGPNGASPHHAPGGRRIQAGDAVVLDFGGRVGGYCSDISRTVSVGEPSPEVKEVHDTVRQAQEAAFTTARPGTPAEEVDRAARRIIEQAGYGREFIHRTGHGIGLEEHEPPYIVEGNGEPLQEGMCFSIEPGIYLEGRFGVRIEDIVTVTAGGARRLNQADRALVVVG